MINSRIRFEVDDDAVESSFSRMRQRAREAFAGVAGETEGMGSPEAFSHIAERISSAQRMSGIHYQESMADIAGRRRTIDSSTMSDAEKDVAHSRLKEQEQTAKESLSEERLQTEILKEMLSSIRTSARDEIREDRSGVERIISQYQRGEYIPTSDDERLKIEEQIAMISGETGDGGESRGLSWRGVAGGMIAASIVSAIARGIMSTMSTLATAQDADTAVAGLWASLPGGGTLAAAQTRHLEQRERYDEATISLHRMGIASVRGGTLFDRTVGERDDLRGQMSTLQRSEREGVSRGIQDLMHRYTLTPGQASQLLLMTREEMNNSLRNFGEVTLASSQDEWSNVSRDVTGAQQIVRLGGDQSSYDNWRDILNYSLQRGRGIRGIRDRIRSIEDSIDSAEDAVSRQRDLQRLGYTQVDLATMTGDIARAQGFVGTEGAADTLGRDYATILAARDVSGGALQTLARGIRTDDVTLNQAAVLVDGIMRGAGVSRVRTGEMYETMNQMVGAWASAGVSADTRRAASMIASFQAMGGTLMDPGAMMSVHQRISQGGDEWDDALAYQAYSRAMASGGQPTSYLGFLQWRERGEGLQERLDIIRRTYGTGQYAVMMARDMLDVRSYEEAERILLGYETIGVDTVSDAEARRRMSDEAIATDRQGQRAEISDAFMEGMMDGMSKVWELMGERMRKNMEETDVPFVEKSRVIEWFENVFGVQRR